jgi:hypothetical protein
VGRHAAEAAEKPFTMESADASAAIAAPFGAPAGWYHDPQRPEVVRWWDGAAWTRTAAAPLTFEIERGFRFGALPPVALARRALVWGIVSVVFPILLPSVLAVITGSMALRHQRIAERAGEQPEGRRMARIGTLLGVVGMLLFVVGGLMLPLLRR